MKAGATQETDPRERELREFMRAKYPDADAWLIDQFVAQAQMAERGDQNGPKATITIPPDAWHESLDDSGKPEHLTTWIEINGVQMHLVGYRRGRIDKDGAYADNEALERIAQGVEPDAPFSAFVFKGRKFVLVATPFPE